MYVHESETGRELFAGLQRLDTTISFNERFWFKNALHIFADACTISMHCSIEYTNVFLDTGTGKKIQHHYKVKTETFCLCKRNVKVTTTHASYLFVIN